MSVETDHVGLFMAECTTRSLGHRVQSSVLHRVYVEWCIANNCSPLSIRRFTLHLKSSGWRAKQSSSIFWCDLQLTSSAGQGAQGGIAALECVWKKTSPLDALKFLQDKLKALGLQG